MRSEQEVASNQFEKGRVKWPKLYLNARSHLGK